MMGSRTWPVGAALLLAGCASPPAGAVNGPAAIEQAAPPAEASSQAEFYAEGRLLMRRQGGAARAILALDSAAGGRGAPVLPGTYRVASDVELGVRATRFVHVVPSPAGRWVAWESGATHDLVGVIPAAGGEPRILDLFFDSSGDSIRWAPGDRYFAVFYASPTGYTALPVYDAVAGKRLRTPWETGCPPRDACRVSAASWSAPATLTVTTATEDGRTRGYRVDAATLAPVAATQRGLQSSSGARVSRVASDPSPRAR
ncbi:MAG TPA: hypothetical protein VE913_22160 [Longimicrobium sp.]|nr:hypothetical protein [Longimicrobium sp.]